MFRKKIATLGLAVATVVSTVGTPVLAATNNATPVSMKADSSSLKLTVPTVIPLVMDAAGNLTASSNGQLVNESNVPVHVSNVAVEPQAPFTIVSDATVATEDNAVDFQFGKEGHLIDAKNPVLVAGQYNLEPVGGANTIELTVTGNAKNVNEDIATDKMIANIKWTFAAGMKGENVVSTLRMTGEEARAAGFQYIQENGGITITRYTGKEVHVVVPAYIDGQPVKQISQPSSVSADGAFELNETIQSVVLPETLEVIDECAFYRCSNLKSVNIPNSVTSIERRAFANCTSLINVVIPNGVTSVGDGAFSACISLSNVEIPNSVTSIGIGAFQLCTSLINVVIPDSVTSIEVQTFYGCTSLINVVIPDSVTSIEGYAFEDCQSLSNVEIPNSVTSIGRDAFYDCKSLSSIVIPDSVTSIGSNAFWGVPHITYHGSLSGAPWGAKSMN